MAGNPMQRKARNYFILGLVVAGVLMGIAVGFLAYKIYNKEDGYKAQINELNNKFEKKYYALNRDIKAMEEVKSEDLSKVQTVKGQTTAPEDYVTPDMLDIEVTDDEGEPILDRNGDPELIHPYHAFTELKAGTILGESMLYQNEIQDDLRLVEFNVFRLLSQAQNGDVVDIRLKLPSGVDLIVLPKKQITIPKVADLDVDNTVWLNLTEEEILLIDSAIVESYTVEGSYLYTTNYISAGQQEVAKTTYSPSPAVMNAMAADTNIVEAAYSAIAEKYSQGHTRRSVDEAINRDPKDDDEDKLGRIIKGMNSEIKKAQDARKDYLDSLED